MYAIDTVLLSACFVILGGLSALAYRYFALGAQSSERLVLATKHASASDLPMWMEEDGKIVWQNATFTKLCKTYPSLEHGSDALPALSEQEMLEIPNTSGGMGVFSLYTSASGTEHFFALTDKTLIQKAETELSRFMKTLTETYAHLPIGLAIFDAERDLSLFNPALVEILGLRPEWLETRPSLKDVLNNLHVSGILPEPQDFRRWRDRFVELAESDNPTSYSEDWHLRDARMLRVTARPHPGHAVAVIVEDLTSHVRIEQQYRHELSQIYSAIDVMTPSIVIFDHTGNVCFSNAAYEALWGEALDSKLQSTHFSDILKTWENSELGGALLQDLQIFYDDTGQHIALERFCSINGMPFTLRATHLPGHRMALEFTPLQEHSSPKKLSA